MPSDSEPLPTASTRSASVASFAKSHSVRSSRAAPSTIRTVVTSPPWARDEPPSPTEEDPRLVGFKENVQRTAEPRPSDVLSCQSSILDDPGPSRWWAFTRHRPTSPSQSTPLTGHQTSRRPLREWERSLSIPWLSRSQQGSPSIPPANPTSYFQRQEEEQPKDVIPADPLRVDIPPPPTTVYTIAQNTTPGWDSPWSARPLEDNTRTINRSVERVQQLTPVDEHMSEKAKSASTWARRRKRVRAYMLYNPYVPLLFRFINIAFTAAAMAIAIRIRNMEARSSVMGAVGSSPTLVIVFASLTLVHVMVAIYTEYFGRPVGLWHTSSKLAYTLIEVVFICAWSAALALTFDNFFTSLIPCASLSSISWYNKLPRATLPSLTGQLGIEGDHICDNQLALICLVGVGLIMYCFNLVISLFRVFERVKYHPANVLPT